MKIKGQWRTARLCASGGCVEVASLIGGGVGVRDSKNPDSAVLTFHPDEWDVFVQGVKGGDFDDM